MFGYSLLVPERSISRASLNPFNLIKLTEYFSEFTWFENEVRKFISKISVALTLRTICAYTHHS